MPRAARIKDPTAIYHTMARSITEFDLFPENTDKDYFLNLLQTYKEKHNCKVYGFCLMTNHYHLLIDPCGFDISKLMKSLNQAYVKFINKKYNRRGHLLAERFNSKIVYGTEYLMTVSAYIHNNPKDIPEFAGKEYEYPYSSMGIYLGKQKDRKKLVDTDFILGSVNETDRSKAIKAYTEMVIERRDIGINKKLREYLDEFQKEQYEYKSYRVVFLRNLKPEEVIKRISERFGIENIGELMHRWKRNTLMFRRVTAYALAELCGMTHKEVCKFMYNISAACSANLSDRGYEAIKNSLELKTFLFGLCKV